MIDDSKHQPRHDPDPDEIEVDEANAEIGGPTSESLEAGLSSSLQPGGTVPSGGPGAGAGSIGTGGGSTANDKTGNVAKAERRIGGD